MTGDGDEPLAADAGFLPNVDRKHYPNGPRTDADGRITLPALIPGAPYRISDWSTVNDQDKGVQIRKDFTVKPGETARPRRYPGREAAGLTLFLPPSAS